MGGKPNARLNDMTIGVGSHGLPCCPHVIVGFFITGSPNTNCNGRKQVRLTDIAAHNCPHCGINMCIGASKNTFCNNLGVARITDPVTEFCGSGNIVTGSHNTNTGG